MKSTGLSLVIGALLLSSGITLFAQPHAPIVTMSISLPEGRTLEVTVPESGLATLTTKDGAEFGFKPTIHDSKPWTRVTVTIFRMATAKAPTELLGDVELKTGGPGAASKTTPSFKIAVPKVTEPVAPKG
jgi:hypothetical protein